MLIASLLHISCPQGTKVSEINKHLLPVQDPALLELFHPYLPRDRRTPAGLKAAMTIKMWRTQLLTGESQVTTPAALPLLTGLCHRLFSPCALNILVALRIATHGSIIL